MSEVLLYFFKPPFPSDGGCAAASAGGGRPGSLQSYAPSSSQTSVTASSTIASSQAIGCQNGPSETRRHQHLWRTIRLPRDSVATVLAYNGAIDTG